MDATTLSTSLLDFDSLLASIPGKKPAGKRLRYTPVYDAVQEARRADEDLPQGDWKRKPKTPDWLGVITLASKALSQQGKDLEIAAWLIEALVKVHGFGGLRAGLRLLRELQERFWESLYPALEDGDAEARMKPLEWLNDKLPHSLKSIPLTRGLAGESYSWNRWEESRSVDNLGRQNPEAHEAAIAEGKITGDQFDKAVAATPRLYYESLFSELVESREQYESVSRVVDERYGRHTPSLLNIKTALEDCFSLVERILKKKRAEDPTYQPAQPGDANMAAMDTLVDEEANGEGQAGPASGRALSLEPVDRADALRRLDAVASYFRKTEPHSPVAYLVERAIQWGKMPLEQWLRDVIGNEEVLSHVRETLGLKLKGE